jgi:hypothetical protein
LKSSSKIQPPLGGTAIDGFNGSGDSRSLFPGDFPNQATLNGNRSPVPRTESNAHFMILDRSGQLIIKRQTSADVIGTLEGRLEIERIQREEQEPIKDRRFALFIDTEKDNFIDDVSFLGFERLKNTTNNEISAVFLHGPLPEDGQLKLQSISSIPLRQIVAVLPAYPKDETRQASA